MLMALISLWTILLFVTPAAVELSVWSAHLGWGQPISTKVCWSGDIYLGMMKRDESSTADAEDMTNLIILARASSGLFLDGMGTYLERKM